MNTVQIQKDVANYLRKRIRTLTPKGIAPFAPVLLFELYALARHPLSLLKARKYRHASRLRIHAGSGGNIKSGWLNVDLSPSADLRIDLRRRLPLPDRCASVIHTDHFLEHLEYPVEATAFLRECYRILEPEGIISISVPDAELILRSYVLGGTKEYYNAQRKCNPPWCTTQMEHINFCFRQNFEHRFMYDFETLEKLLLQCGFSDIRKRDFDASLDQELRIVGSLYVEACKFEYASSQHRTEMAASYQTL